MENFRQTKTYEREIELSEIEHYLQVFLSPETSNEDKQFVKKWLHNKLLEYAKVQLRNSVFEQRAFIEEFKDKILTVLADTDKSE